MTLLSMAAIGICLAIAESSQRYRFTSDVADYFEQARCLLAARPTQSIVDGVDGPLWAPSTNFPIGFPLALAAMAQMGLPLKSAALMLNGFAAIAIPLVAFFALWRHAPDWQVAIFVLASASPGLLYNASFGLTDCLALLLVMLCFAAVLRQSTASLLLAGVLAGAAYTVRNAHLALIAALYAYMVVLAWHAKSDFRWQFVLAFTIGLSLVLAPLFTRNLLVFGAINPYYLEPSNIGAVENLRTFLKEVVENLTNSSDLARLVAWTRPGLVLSAIGLAATIGLTLVRLRTLSPQDRWLPGLALGFALAGSVLVIAARTRYWWGEPINSRHAFPYTAFYAVALASSWSWSGWTAKLQRAARFAPPLILLALVLGRLGATWAEARSLKLAAPPDSMAAYAVGAKAMCQREVDREVISNYAFVFRIECAAPARFIMLPRDVQERDLATRRASAESFLLALPSKLAGRDISIVIAPGRYGFRKGEDLPFSADMRQRLEQAGYAFDRNDAAAVVLSFAADATASRPAN